LERLKGRPAALIVAHVSGAAHKGELRSSVAAMSASLSRTRCRAVAMMAERRPLVRSLSLLAAPASVCAA
jgi:hypothetical protein